MVMGGGCSSVQEWCPNSDMKCIFCYELGQNNVGGRQKKKLGKVNIASMSTLLPRAVLTTVK